MKISVLKSRLSLGFQRVALIEADAHFGAQIRNYAEDIGVRTLEVCPDADSFFARGPSSFDLVILDWNIKGTNGLTVFNRLRHDPRYSTLPILVISGFVDRRDFRLLEEFPLTRLVEKPFTAGVFIEAVQSLQHEKTWVRNHEKALSKLLMHAADVPRVKKLQKLLQDAPYPGPLLLMLGRYLSREKRWDEAHELLDAIVREDRTNVLALNELGKVLHARGHHREALAVLAEADQLSPDNLKRICHLGELQLHHCQLQDARKSFERALKVDGGWERAQKGHELTLNAFEFLQAKSATVPFPQSFASLMNSIGITKVRNGHLNEGIQHYESALMFIRDVDSRAKVMFNMGLGYLRHRVGDKALLWFMRSAKTGGRQFHKARSYVSELTSKVVWTEQGFLVEGQKKTVEVDAHDMVRSVPTDARETESINTLREPISFVSEDGPSTGVLELEDFDTDALLSGIAEEGFC